MVRRAWPYWIAALAGLVSGLAIFTFGYARGASYMTNDPNACANCHVMNEQLDGWMRGSHHSVAVCNDCHAPHGALGKYSTKALNGLLHSWAFTTGRFPEPIQITGRNHGVTEGACRHCHQDLVDSIDHRGSGPGGRPQDAVSCIRCHADVGHR